MKITANKISIIFGIAAMAFVTGCCSTSKCAAPCDKKECPAAATCDTAKKDCPKECPKACPKAEAK